MGDVERQVDTLERFKQWREYEETHLHRFVVILERQVNNLRDYVNLFRTYPANSSEFAVEVQRLFSELGTLLDEFHENNNDIMNDLDAFKGILESLSQDINKLPKDWGKKKKNRKHK